MRQQRLVALADENHRLKMKRLLLFAALTSLFHGLACSSELPRDVAQFLKKREACDHWRGESGYDDERQADIDWSICQSCPGTDTALVRLKRKHQSNPAVLSRLQELEDEIEPKDKAAAQRFCKATRKPAWQK